MAQNNTLGRNIEFPIMNSDGTPFHALVLHKATYESTIMSLGDKITGDVYYADNTLAVTMQEYIEYGGVHYVLVTPPTIVKEGIVSDNGQLNGMTKYSFTFYHPMYMLSNFPFSDVAVTSDETQYLSESKKFSWCGTGIDFIAKLNKNLENTQWVVATSDNTESLAKLALLPSDVPANGSTDTTKSNVLTFDNVFISDALKTLYDTWEVPFVVDTLNEGEYYDSYNNDYYESGKMFVVVVGLPSNEILDSENEPFVFQFGKGVGLKNNSRTPRNNKIITRIAGTGSERNIPYGYPQVRWYGAAGAKFTYGDSAGVYTNVTIGGHTFSKVVSYPIYKGILGGQYVELIKHPFTRKTLMPSIYATTLFNKISPYLANGSVNTNYNPDLTIVDYYDAIGNTYPNPIVPDAPSYETHQFDNVYPRLGSAEIVGVLPYDEPKETTSTIFPSVNLFLNVLNESIGRTNNGNEKATLQRLYNAINGGMRTYADSNNGGSYTFNCTVTNDGNGTMFVKYTSDGFNIDTSVTYAAAVVEWDDTMDDDGKYKQQYFKMTLPQLDFDLYACANITEQMNIVMRSGSCIGCTFEVSVDWDDYKNNFFHEDGSFDPTPHTSDGDGHVRDATKYPNSANGQITVIVKKDLDTFGVLMPNTYQQPVVGDEFVITGISLPESYITNAELELETTSQQYMLENNVHYYDYPLKFDEYFLATHTNILSQIRNNTIIEFKYGNETPNKKLYVKQISIKYGEKPLPQYDITLTDDVEVVLNQIGQVTDDVSRLRLQLTELMQYYGVNGVLAELIAEKLSRINDDVAEGRITFKQGLVSSAEIITESAIQSSGFVSGLYTGKGWRIDELGNAELESLRVRSYLEVIELLINRVQAMEGDTMFSDNDQIEKVTTEYDANNQFVSYKLSLKEKWSGYVTAQLEGNILKGIINTLAAKQAGVSDESNNNINKQGVDDGGNRYYTSWMRVTETHNSSNSTLGVNEIRVVLYGDNDTPAKKNFAPCELMTIARWGCLDADDNASASVRASVKRRQTVFYLSASEGRIVKLTGVNKPILEDGNYGMVFGTIPDFIKRWSSWGRLVVQHPHLEDRDYLYAQGLIYQDLVHVDIKGAPVPVTVDCGDWVNGGTASGEITDEYGDVVQLPTIRHGIYFNVGWNPKSQQFERHTVRHNNGTWLCLQNQPVTVNGVSTYYEPEYNSLYWKLIDGDGRYRIEIESSNGDVFNAAPATTLTPKLFFGNVDITNKIPTSAWSWERSSESGSTSADTAWNNNHIGVRVLTLSASDYPSGWSDNNKAIFTAKVKIVLDGILSAYAFEIYPSYTWGNPSTYPPVGTTVLLDYEDPTEDMIDVWEESSIQSNIWVEYGIDVGSIYLCSYDNHLYKATSNGWSDMGEYTGGIVSQRFIAAKVSNGTSPIVADLDNEMDGVACDVGGDSDHSQTCTTTASLIQGSTKKSFTLKIREWDEDDQEYNEITQSGSTLTDVVVNWTDNSDNSKTITFTFGKGVTINDKREFIVVMIADNLEYKAVFTVNGVLPGANGEPATLYQIIPSQDKMAFSRLAEGGLTPDDQYLTFTVKKTVGDETTIIYTAQLAQNNLIARYSTSDPPASKTSGVAWGVRDIELEPQISFNNIGNAVISKNVTFQQIYIALFGSDGTLHDRETIPVIKDGANGTDGKDGKDASYIHIQGTARDIDDTIVTTLPRSVSINGVNQTVTQNRGITLAIINRQTLVVSETDLINYDTYGSSTAISNLTTKLNSLDDTVFVALCSADAIGWNSNLVTALKNFGLGELPYDETGRYPFAFLGYKGLDEGYALMQMHDVGNYDHVAEVGAYIVDGVFMSSKDGKDGENGDTIQMVTVYKKSDSAPATPSGSTIPPSGWQTAPEFTSTSGKLDGKGKNNAFVKQTVWFKTTQANQQISVYLESSSEENYDYIICGAIDENINSRPNLPSDPEDDESRILDRYHATSGDGSSTSFTLTAQAAGVYHIDIVYTKDSSSQDGEDCGWWSVSGAIIQSPISIWASTAKFINNAISGTWSTPVRWNGNDGKDGVDGNNGKDATTYTILIQSASAIVGANGKLNVYIMCTIRRDSGTSSTQQYYAGSVKAVVGNWTTASINKNGSEHSLTIANANWSSYDSPKEIVLQYWISNANTPLATTTVPITIQGQMGRNIYYAGMFDDVVGTTFTATDYEAPYVNIGTTSSPQCYVYVGDNGNISYPSTAEGFANNSNWELMETNFNYLITKAMFSDFAKLGSAIFNKDYMFSQYLENEFVMLGSYQSINNTVYFEAINGQTSIPVTAGVTYTLLITCATTSGASVPVTFRVYYNTKSDWTGTEHAGVADVNNTSTTTSTVEHTFTAEYDGYVRLYGMGVGSVTKIASKASASYNEVSPMFLNGDDILLVTNTQATNSTTQMSVVALPIPVNNGRQYTVSFYGYVGGGTGYVYVLQNGSNIASTSFSNTSPAQKSITFTASASGNVYIQYKSSSSSYYTYIYRMYIKCDNAMIPKVAVNWLNGYAHFAGDNVRFNPNGSGFVAGGNINWNEIGDAVFNGELTAGDMKVTRRQESNHVWSGMYTPLLSEAVSIGVRNYNNNSHSGEILLLGSGEAGGYVYTYAGGDETGSKFELSYARPIGTGNRSRIVLASGDTSYGSEASISVQTTVESGGSATVITPTNVSTTNVDTSTIHVDTIHPKTTNGYVSIPSNIITGSGTKYLPSNPRKGMVIFAKGTTGSLTISGNGKPIMGANGTNTDSSITIGNASFFFVYDGDRWIRYCCTE